jgi:L,D-transpeptidase catalytic domain/Putative peptidoglycan binding domain/PKD domain
VRRILAFLPFLLALGAPAGASAAPPSVSASASPGTGAAPLAVTLHADGDALAYHWDLGDGTFADGQTVEHTYAAGSWTAVVTATAADGETTQARVQIAAVAIAAHAPAAAWGKPLTISGSVTPAIAGLRLDLLARGVAILHATTGASGAFHFRIHRVGPPVSFQVRAGDAVSAPIVPRVHPILKTQLAAAASVGRPLALVARLVPDQAGTLLVRVYRDGRLTATRRYGSHARLPLDTHSPRSYRLQVTAVPADGWYGALHRVTAAVVEPQLGPGSHGPSVARLQQELAALHYFVPQDGAYGSETVDAVYAFQKIQGLPRTGAVDARLWRALASPVQPKPRYSAPADHIEIDKEHQVLYVVRGGRVAKITPVSTAGIPGHFTPVGRFSIYRKVTGFDPSPLGTLYDPMYFTGGYAIHGNPSVPPYPASHGCVRVPMWIAPLLFDTNAYGEAVFVY